MIIQTILTNMLLLATFLCTLTTGFVLIFAIVVMPGIGTLNDRDFLRAFKVIDGVIQKNQPIFAFVWAGSVVALIIATVLGFQQLAGLNRTLIITAAALYLIGVQLPTAAINIPRNNRVQALNIETLDEASAASERHYFESTWNRWNMIRTILAGVASGLLLVVVWLL